MRDGQAITAQLGGYRDSSGWRFFCPCHDDHPRPSASIRARDGIVTCWRGCPRADVYAALDALGLTDDGKRPKYRPEDSRQKIRNAQMEWWAATERPYDVECLTRYLLSRGIVLP